MSPVVASFQKQGTRGLSNGARFRLVGKNQGEVRAVERSGVLDSGDLWGIEPSTNSRGKFGEVRAVEDRGFTTTECFGERRIPTSQEKVVRRPRSLHSRFDG